MDKHDIDIIIPTKGKVDYLTKCIRSIVNKTKTVSYHIHVADTGSDEIDLKKIFQFIKKEFSKTKNISLHKYDYYNFARINNNVVEKKTTADTILFCNNDIELIDPCIDRMYEELQKEGDTAGTVGCKLLFKNETIQHAGQECFTHRPRGYWHQPVDKLEVTHRGLGTKNTYEDVSYIMGNTAALMMMRRDVFYDIGGFVEAYKECFEDVHLNMEVALKGYRNIYIDCVRAFHSESVTRTKSQEAMQKLEYDYFKSLSPWWNALPDEDKQYLSAFRTAEKLKPTGTYS